MSQRLVVSMTLSGAVVFSPILAYGQYWDTEVVDATTADVGLFTSIALDSNNNPHISYRDTASDYLKYAWYDGSWHLTNVDTTANVGQYTSIALDSNNNPHISYYDLTNDYLKYARYDGSWHLINVDTAANTGQYTSIALDSNNNPYISYYEVTHGYLRYARYDGAAWHPETVDAGGPGGDTGKYTSIALDSDNNPHISYYDYNLGRVLYARYDGAWHFQEVDIVGLFGGTGGTSIALDSNGLPHVSYYDYTNHRLRYARYDGAAWHPETVDATAAVIGQYSSIALDSNNNPHISYYDSTSGYLRYARYDGAAWHLENADMVHDVGRYSSLALDSANNPRISYYDATEDSLKYARWVPPVPAATPTPRYVELNVAGGPDFAAGATLTLNWEVHPDSYGFAGSPRDVYLGVILSPEGALENAAPSVPEVLGTSGTLMLFHPATSGPHAYPPTEPAWRNVRFPLASGNSGSLNFTVPANVGQRCVFVAGFSPFPVPDQCVTSNGFNLPPLSSPPTPVAPSGRSGAFYLPGNYTQQALPLLVAFHGTGGDGAGMVAGFQALADEYGFIIVAPDSGDPAVWWISEAGSESDDYPIIMDWVDYIRSYPGVTIDDDYVMTLGFSGGAPVAPYIATNDEQFTAFAAMHGEVWEPSIGPNLALAWLSTGADDWWTPAMFEGYADMLDGRGFSVTLNIYPGGHVVSAEEQRAAIDWWLR